MDGERVFVGTEPGAVYSLDVTTGTPTQLTLPATLETGYVVQLEVVSTSLVFALYAGTSAGHLLVFDGFTWQEIPLPVSETVYSIAVDWSTSSIYVATDTSVYQGTQEVIISKPGVPIGFRTSFSWTDGSSGLPARSHCAHLRIGLDRGVKYLYLATYGRSMYRAALDNGPANRPGLGTKSGTKVLFGVIQDGGGAVLDPSTGKIIIVPPRQEMQAVLADLLAGERLRGDPSPEAQTTRRAALERVHAFVQTQLDETRSGK
jgi:hypothetical protein